jgi:hypothetical protein
MKNIGPAGRGEINSGGAHWAFLRKEQPATNLTMAGEEITMLEY